MEKSALCRPTPKKEGKKQTIGLRTNGWVIIDSFVCSTLFWKNDCTVGLYKRNSNSIDDFEGKQIDISEDNNTFR